MNNYIVNLICLVVGYLCGSVLFANIITRLVVGKEIRELGNNNPGAYNVFNNAGKFWGVFTGILDGLKAFVPMLVAHRYFNVSNTGIGLIGVGAVIGHGYPLFFKFKGGRAASSLMGMFLFFIPYELLAAFAIDLILLYTIVKKDFGFWGPFGIIAIAATLCLFFNHPVEVKILIWVGGLLGVYFNRKFIPLRTKQLLNKAPEDDN
ncbi:MAG TPA: glycerol-3-phosphate acyltransferase [Tenuifilaceae bacterium]|nr:glycerol-3-phosphate acyltransferase [Tenuifilaceae bacterium]HOG72633.1 glycerol-3-phosphate acyltransferase [Tenuifilaceae bacterium]HPA67941.1 glycerol-3-phosphate acyltransferase [Tenuifilaceae bacterium]HPW26004.1 glycerol-3-phosphate acyltransferase [Tenuifilaceae bacterium]HQN84320.1 glycerol-3-phosphate acyltransferase [Tenuifilaceae bacterium]